ncbi:anti-sigma factor [Dongia sp.]|uniref:anti-sigma factor family protein n=1 Tax=Dongia sp. TaxID=1977262 RepID=UPI0035B3E97D
MSNRPITEDDLHAFVDLALAPSRQAEIAEYLATHPDVAERVEDYRAQRGALRAAFAPIAEEPVPPELNVARMASTRRSMRVSTWRAAAAVLLLLGSGATGWSLHGWMERVPVGIAALAQEAAASYAVYAPDHIRPVEIRADDRASLVAWASERLGHPVTVPDLAAAGYRFMGGRLVATTHGAAILFMYDDDRGTRLVILSRPMAAERDTPMAEHIDGAIAGFTWADAGIGYSLVGPLTPDRLHPLADDVRRQISSKI